MISVSILGIKDNKINNYEILDKTDVDYIHIDIMDNIFVPNKNEFDFSYKFNKKIDVHLMVRDVEHYIDKYKYLNPEYITFHLEAVKDIEKVIKKIKDNNIKVGIAIRPDTDLYLLNSYLDKVDLVLIMSVQPGFGGQKFIENSIKRIAEMRKLKEENNYNYLIEVDGGINLATFNKVNADIKVVGSYITSSDNYQDAIDKLKNNRS